MAYALRCFTLLSLGACGSCGLVSEGDVSSGAFLDTGDAALRRAIVDDEMLQSAHAECDVRELARLTDTRTDNSSVQHYASTMLQEHGALFVELRQLAQERGGTLPYEMSDEGADQLNMLRSDVGPPFDRAYLAGQIQLQQAAQAAFYELQRGLDGGVRHWALESADVWRRDEAWARQIYGAILTGTGIDDTRRDP